MHSNTGVPVYAEGPVARTYHEHARILLYGNGNGERTARDLSIEQKLKKGYGLANSLYHPGRPSPNPEAEGQGQRIEQPRSHKAMTKDTILAGKIYGDSEPVVSYGDFRLYGGQPRQWGGRTSEFN